MKIYSDDKCTTPSGSGDTIDVKWGKCNPFSGGGDAVKSIIYTLEGFEETPVPEKKATDGDASHANMGMTVAIATTALAISATLY